MKICPQCDGKKKVTIKVVTVGPKGQEESFTTECLTCKGKGKLTEKEAEAHKQFHESWCRCEEPGEVHYVPDGQDARCTKHHWRCSKCNKITQVG